MKKIYYITRSYPVITPYSGGGAIIREGAVEFLRKSKFDVWVVAPNYKGREIVINEKQRYILIPLTINLRLALIYEYIGYYEDYLDVWIKDAFDYLKDKVREDDIAFSTSGSELSMIKLGYLLKESTRCKFVINLHDPIYATRINGKRIKNSGKNLPHVNRDKAEKKYITSADYVITSSNTYAEALKNKYSEISDRILNNYFGYISKINVSNNDYNSENELRIICGGNLGKAQRPEILAEVCSKMDGVRAIFIGDYSQNKKLISYSSSPTVELKQSMKREEYLKFVIKNADVGFLSLTSDLSTFCVPSKLYEYINLELPVLGAIKGDARNIINNNKYGIACKYSVKEIQKALQELKNKQVLDSFKSNIKKDKVLWSMENKIKEVINILNQL